MVKVILSFIAAIIGGVVRLAVGAFILWAITHRILKPGQISDADIEMLVLAISTGIAMLLYTAWKWIIHRRIVNTAIAVFPGVTLDDVKQAVKDGAYAPATTPTNIPPEIRSLAKDILAGKNTNGGTK